MMLMNKDIDGVPPVFKRCFQMACRRGYDSASSCKGGSWAAVSSSSCHRRVSAVPQVAALAMLLGVPSGPLSRGRGPSRSSNICKGGTARRTISLCTSPARCHGVSWGRIAP